MTQAEEEPPPGFFGGEWTQPIGTIVLAFGAIEYLLDVLIEKLGSIELRECHEDKPLAARVQAAKKLGTRRCADVEVRELVLSTLADLETLAKKVRNHVAHGALTFVLGPGTDGGSKITFRPRGEDKPRHFSLEDLRAAATQSRALNNRFEEVIRRLSPR